LNIATAEGQFTADVAGPVDGPLVVLLHGFPQSRHSWRDQVPFLASHGYRAVAPDGRGYSPAVRPDPGTQLQAYALARLVQDVIDIADACAPAPARFHLVGHDWGGQVAWATAAQHPERVASLAVLSRPHPEAFKRALQADADGQKHRSRHHTRFHDPQTATLLLDDDARRLRGLLAAAAVPPEHIDEYLSVIGNAPALEAALAWYRAAGTLSAANVDVVRVPTLYVWGDADASVGQTAAEGTANFVDAPYRFECLRGIGHFITDEVPGTVNALLLEHVRAHPTTGAQG